MLVHFFFPQKVYFSTIFDFHFRDNPPFRDEFQAMSIIGLKNSAAQIDTCKSTGSSFNSVPQYTQKDPHILNFICKL